MSNNINIYWKVATYYFGGIFRKITNNKNLHNFDPNYLYNEFSDIYNNLLNNSSCVIELFDYMKSIIMNNNKNLMKQNFSPLFAHNHDYRLTKYAKYFTKEKLESIKIMKNFPETIKFLNKFIPKSINEFLYLCGIFNGIEMIEFYFYSHIFIFYYSHISKKRVNEFFDNLISMPLCDISKIDMTYCPKRTDDINNLTNIEKQYNHTTNTSFNGMLSIYGEEYVLDQIWKLKICDYIATKIIDLPEIQCHIININKVFMDIFELIKRKSTHFCRYPLSIVNVNNIDCYNNKENDMYISPIYFLPLENYRCYKLSDGYCYSVIEIYYLNSNISPMTRQEFNKKDIDNIKYIKNNFVG
jgi:hypothetical protein